MQGESSTMDSFPESADIGQGSISNSNMMPTESNMLHPIESRLSNSMMPSGETMHISSTIHDAHNCNGWSSGGNSSGFNLQNEFNDDRMKMDVWSSPFSIHPGSGARSVEKHFEPTNNHLPWGGDIGSSHNEVRNGFSFLRGSSSNSIPQSGNLNAEHEGSSVNGRQGMGAVVGSNLTMSSGFDIEQTSSADALSDKTATSSGSGDYMEENDGGSSSSVRIWGISCKRKALEGTSRPFPGESLISFPQPETGWHAGTSTYGQSSLSLSTPARASPPLGSPESHNAWVGAGRRALTYDSFPSSSVTENLESPLTNLGRRATAWTPQDSVPFHLLPAGSSGHPNIYPTHQLSSLSPFTDSADLRTTATLAANFRAPQGQSHTMQTPGSSRSIDLFPWVGASTSRLGSLSNSSFHGESSSAVREDLNLQSSTRYSGANPTFLPCPEMRNSSQDPTTWNLGTGITSTSGVPSTVHVGPLPSIHSFPNPAHTPSHNRPTENQQRVPEFAPWSLFPNATSESGTHAGHFSSSPSGFPFQDHTAMLNGPNRRGHHQSHSRSPSFLGRLGNNALGTPHSLRALADDMEGRRRLITEIRQVLSAMRRNDFRVEDHMLFDPFIVHPMPEVHDRHRDMRLDVDNMSYEELLALEERMGHVSTGLGEAAIMKFMKQRKYASMISKSPLDMEPCCVCQEHYADGDDMGTLDCGHDFHTNCIKQWVLQKNLCPICKTTALRTEKEDK